MNITTAVYSFHTGKVIIKIPFKIVRETDACYFTEQGRYLKSEIGVARLKYPTSYPYVEVHMVDADEDTLKAELGKWFLDRAVDICG